MAANFYFETFKSTINYQIIIKNHMKSINISILSILFLCFMGISYAKTLEDLVSEFHDAYAKDWASAKAWCDENDADLKTSFNVCKDKDVITGDEYNKTKGMFTIAYIMGVQFEASDWILCKLHAWTFVRQKLADDPTFYTDLKINKFKLGDKQLSQTQISNAAIAAKDFSYFETATIDAFKDLYWEDGTLFTFLATNILGMNDIVKAKEICNKMEAALILDNNAKNSATLSRVQSLSKALTARMLDAKLK